MAEEEAAMLKKRTFWLWFAFALWNPVAALICLVFLEALTDPIFHANGFR